jgi:DNA polymerase elongation subunit (family B)
VLPCIANTLLDQRDAAKREMKDANKVGDLTLANILDAKQQALKVICNSLYGGLNAILKGALYCRPLGGVVTSEGREAIVAIQDSVRSVDDCTIVAGDTDSVMFLLKGRTLNEAAEVGCKIAKDVTQKLHVKGAKKMFLEYQMVSEPFHFCSGSISPTRWNCF